jgi:hypothetical protein
VRAQRGRDGPRLRLNNTCPEVLAILYENLYTRPGADVSLLEDRQNGEHEHDGNMMGMNMEDPVIRERVMRDTTMRRMMSEMQSMPAAHEMNMSDITSSGAYRSVQTSSLKNRSRAKTSTKTRIPSSMTKKSGTSKTKSSAAKGTSTAVKKAGASKPTPKPAMPPMDHSKMNMPGMEMPPAKKK